MAQKTCHPLCGQASHSDLQAQFSCMAYGGIGRTVTYRPFFMHGLWGKLDRSPLAQHTRHFLCGQALAQRPTGPFHIHGLYIVRGRSPLDQQTRHSLCGETVAQGHIGPIPMHYI